MEELSTKESSDSDSAPERSQQAASLPVQSARGATGSISTGSENDFPEDGPDGWLQEAIMPVGESKHFFPSDILKISCTLDVDCW